MAIPIVGLRVTRIPIQNESCMNKSFPNFWELWDKISKIVGKVCHMDRRKMWKFKKKSLVIGTDTGPLHPIPIIISKQSKGHWFG